MANFLSRLFARGALVPAPRYEGSTGGVMLWLQGGALDTRPIKTRKEQLSGYVGWCYAAASRIAADVRANPWTLWDRTGISREDWRAVDESKINSALLRPNASQMLQDFLEITQLHLDLAGEALWHRVTRPDGKTVGLQILYPHWVDDVVQDQDTGQVTAYKLMIPGRSGSTVVQVIDVCHIKYPHPLDPLRGCSPLEAFALSHDMDMYARAYGGTLLKNRAMPDVVLTSEQDLTSEQMDLIRERWVDRHRGAGGGPAVLSKGANIKQLSLSMADLKFLELTQASREQILGAYGMPAAKLGLTTDFNRANSETADATYKENCLLPRLRRQENAINGVVLPWIYGKEAQGLYFEFESPVDEDRDYVLKRANEALDRSAITINEYRDALGFDPKDGLDVYKVGLGSTFVPEPAATSVRVEPTPIDEARLLVQIKEIVDGAVAARAKVQAKTRGLRFSLMSREEVEKRFLRAQGELEDSLREAARRLFLREKEIVVEAFRKEGTDRAFALRSWIDDALSAATTDWQSTLAQYLLRGYREGWLLLGAEVETSLSWDVFREQAVTIAETLSGSKITGIQSVTREAVQDVLSAGIEQGWSIDKIADAIGETYDGFSDARAVTIARTEMTGAVNGGKEYHAEEIESELGLELTKEWIATADDVTRETHLEADGQVVPRGDSFQVGSDELDYPGDPSGSPEEIINCRCTVAFAAE